MTDDDGNDMVYPWPDSDRTRRSLRWAEETSRDKREVELSG